LTLRVRKPNITYMQSKQFDPTRVTARRQALKLNRVELGRAAGVSHVTIFRWEKGVNVPDGASIGRLATALGRSPSYFYVDPESTKEV